MCFTNKHLTTLPDLTLCGEVVPYTTTHTFLGLRLDGPRFSWAKHIDYLHTPCNKRLDVMKRVVGVRWGAKGDLLLRYYTATVRAKISYGSCFYGSAARTILEKIDPLQNAALRIAMGAMSSSPIISLQAESGLLPFGNYRQQMTSQQLYSTMYRQDSYPLKKLYTEAGIDRQTPVWVPGARILMLVRALLALKALNLNHAPPQPNTLHCPIPPWQDLSSMIALDIPGNPSKSTATCPATIPCMEIDRSIYHHHIKIYTDGSHSHSSTAAAIFFPSQSICKTWRLHPITDVLTAELYAIQQVFTFLPITYLGKGKVVIYTDSLSSLHLILSHHPSSSTYIVHDIQRALVHLTTVGWDKTLQWVPSHSGIHGNDIVDAAAKMALSLPDITELPQPLSIFKRLIKKECRISWNSILRDSLHTTKMSNYRTDSSPHPWVRRQSRVQDVALTRLSIGHTPLSAHLHRLNLVPDPYCP